MFAKLFTEFIFVATVFIEATVPEAPKAVISVPNAPNVEICDATAPTAEILFVGEI